MEKTWPAANEMGLGWTAKYPRPTEDNGRHPALLASRQATWDAAEAVRVKNAERVDAIRAEREAEEAAKRDAAAATADAKRETQRAEQEATLRRRFIAAGGTEAEWGAEKAEIVAEHRRRAVAGVDEADARARQAQAQLYKAF